MSQFCTVSSCSYPEIEFYESKSHPSHFFYIIFNFGCTCLTFWGRLSPDYLLFTGQSDEHSGQAVVNKREQLHLDAQDCQLPGTPHRSLPIVAILLSDLTKSCKKSHPSKWLTSKDLPGFIQPRELQTRVEQSERKIKNGRKKVFRITESYLSTFLNGFRSMGKK